MTFVALHQYLSSTSGVKGGTKMFLRPAARHCSFCALRLCPQHCEAPFRAAARTVLEPSASWCTLPCMTGQPARLHSPVRLPNTSLVASVTGDSSPKAAITHAAASLDPQASAGHVQSTLAAARQPSSEASAQVCEQRSGSGEAAAAGACAGGKAGGLWRHVHAEAGREGG